MVLIAIADFSHIIGLCESLIKDRFPLIGCFKSPSKECKHLIGPFGSPIKECAILIGYSNVPAWNVRIRLACMLFREEVASAAWPLSPNSSELAIS